MKIKRLLNSSELKAKEALDRAVLGSGYSVESQVPLSSILELDLGETLPKRDWNSLKHCSFDFVVLDSLSTPQFAIEFDGPHHALPENQRADIFKNRLCMRARFPLLRVSDLDLVPHEQVTVVEWIVSRFVAWHSEMDAIRQEISERVVLATKAEIAEWTSGGVADPELDPTFWFDVRHPFPGTRIIADRIWHGHGIVVSFAHEGTSQRLLSGAEVLFEQFRHSISPEGAYVLDSKTFRLIRRDGKEAAELHEVNAAVRVRAVLLAAEDFNPDDDILKYAQLHSRLPMSFHEILGATAWEIADHMCEFQGVKKLESWLTERGRGTF